jgi:hypothetical protein
VIRDIVTLLGIERNDAPAIEKQEPGVAFPLERAL